MITPPSGARCSCCSVPSEERRLLLREGVRGPSLLSEGVSGPSPVSDRLLLREGVSGPSPVSDRLLLREGVSGPSLLREGVSGPSLVSDRLDASRRGVSATGAASSASPTRVSSKQITIG